MDHHNFRGKPQSEGEDGMKNYGEKFWNFVQGAPFSTLIFHVFFMTKK